MTVAAPESVPSGMTHSDPLRAPHPAHPHSSAHERPAGPLRVEIAEASKDAAREVPENWPQTPAEFEALIDALQDQLVRCAFRRLKDFGEAEDAVQEVFIKAFTRRHELSGVRPVAPYLYRMLTNLCTDRLRRPRPIMVPIEGSGAENIPSKLPLAIECAAAAEQIRIAESLIEKLPKGQADVVRMRALDGLSIAEIAEIQRRPLATIKSRLRYGLASLRKILSRRKERTL